MGPRAGCFVRAISARGARMIGIVDRVDFAHVSARTGYGKHDARVHGNAVAVIPRRAIKARLLFREVLEIPFVAPGRH